MSLCQAGANPISRLAGKSEQLRGVGRLHDARPGVGSVGGVRDGREAQFRGAGASAQPMAQPVPHPMAAAPAATDAWVNQFSNMHIKDPLSFSSEYQRLYSSYEQPQAVRPAQPQTLHAVQPQYQRQFYPSSYSQSLSQQFSQSFTADNSALFDSEFDQIEQEEAAQQLLQQQQAPAAQDTATAVPALDDEQAKFQQAASEIYARLSPGPQTPPEMEAKLHNPKLQNSKFLGLMRRISDGVVTLQNDQNSQKYTQLYSPTTGEVVGNEYFPVVDAILEP